MTSPITQRSHLLWQWQTTLCDGFDMLTSTDPHLREVRAVPWETADQRDDPARAWMAVDWAVRTMAPAWLEAAELGDQAAALRALPPVTAETATGAHAAATTAITAAVTASTSERNALPGRSVVSRDAAITIELAAGAGDQVVARQSCGRLVMLAAAAAGVAGVAGVAGDVTASQVAASAVHVAKAAAQAVVWRWLCQDVPGGEIATRLRAVAYPLLTSAADLYVAMADVS